MAVAVNNRPSYIGPHSPNLSQTIGDAQVMNSLQEKITVCRSAKVMTRGKAKPQFKTMDATMSVSRNGRDTTISKR